MRMIAASVWLFIILFVTIFANCNSHARTWHMDVRSPCDIMVDVVNNIGLNILKVHNLNNENNIALSPYGTVSILTALLEGVQGSAEHEIQTCGGFPSNRDIVRIGLRDIHRLLRTYFIPREGFLSGLSLSTEKVILKPEYLSVLRFYGYDMTSFNTPIYPTNLETTTPMTNVTEYTTMPPDTESTEKREDDETTTTKLPQTTLPETTLPQTTLPETTLPPSTETTLPETTLPMTTVKTTLPETTLPPTTVKTTLPETTLPPTTIGTTLPETTTKQTATETLTTITEIPTTVPVTTQRITTTVLTTTETTLPTTEPPETTTPAKSDISKRSIAHYLVPGFPYNPDLPRYNSIEHSNAFLVNGKFPESHVRFMTYETILPFYYIPNLNALALRFPLDSPKYYLLLILPVDDDGIERIICDIGNAVTLKQIISHLRPTFVRAVIPSFTLRGLVTLTSSLQKIGIKQIFEPYRADFSPLTNDTNVYVTNIEQAITVIIKNYMDMDPSVSNINNNHNLYHHEEPVEFKATHPFLYFVMDSEIDVALIAGKIVNPINSRIQ